MRFNLHSYKLKYLLLPCIFSTVVVFVALFMPDSRNWLLPVLFLLLPFLDFQWRIPPIFLVRQSLIRWASFVLIIIILLLKNAQLIDLFAVMVVIAALPEEWFFRAYLQKRLGNSVIAVLVVSLLFSSMHYITQNSAAAWLVFLPSIFFSWVYIRTGDIVLVVVIHALSNLLYYLYLKSYIVEYLSL